MNRPKHTRHRIRLSARNARALRGVIDHAVAIVVDAVADFHRGIDIANANDIGHLALRDAECTRRHVARAARFARVGRRVVDGSIAIVIEAIAGLQDLIFDAEIRANAYRLPTLAFGRSCVNRFRAFAVGIAVTNRANRHIGGNVIGCVDLAITIVIDSVADLDPAIGDVALVFATRGVGIIEVPETIARSGAVTGQELALRIRVRTRRHPIIDAFGCAIDRHTLLAALTAIRGARAQIDVFVFDAIAIVVLVIADIVHITGLDAVIFADLVIVEIEIILRAFVALTNTRKISRIGARIAFDRHDVAVQQLGEAIVIACTAALNAREVDVRPIVDFSVTIIVGFIADFDAAVGRDASPTTATDSARKDASAFTADIDVSADAHAACATGARRGWCSRIVATIPAIRGRIASGKTGHRESCGSDENQVRNQVLDVAIFHGATSSLATEPFARLRRLISASAHAAASNPKLDSLLEDAGTSHEQPPPPVGKPQIPGSGRSPEPPIPPPPIEPLDDDDDDDEPDIMPPPLPPAPP